FVGEPPRVGECPAFARRRQPGHLRAGAGVLGADLRKLVTDFAKRLLARRDLRARLGEQLLRRAALLLRPRRDLARLLQLATQLRHVAGELRLARRWPRLRLRVQALDAQRNGGE